MKRLILIAGIATLSACAEREEAAEAPAAEEIAAAPAAAAVVATPGKYDVTLPDGTMFVSELMADGTYQDWTGDEVTEKGAWASKDGKTCFDPEGDAAEACFTAGAPAADGSFTSTNDAGETVTVKPQAG